MADVEELKKRPSARIHAIVARNARTAVVFRRGPSKQVLCLTWDLKRDTLEAGQWLKGRIYERRCDLSPDGSRLVYFAANFRVPVYSWSAVSRPPWLTAEYFYPKGDCWGGGGLFESNSVLRLNHAVEAVPLKQIENGRRIPNYMRSGASMWTKLPPQEKKPSGLHVSCFEESSGAGEDNPIWSKRMQRDGWLFLANQAYLQRDGIKSKLSFRFDPPVGREKSARSAPLSIRVLCHGIGESGGQWHVETAELRDGNSRPTFEFGRVDWIEFDHNDDVLFSQSGRLFRLKLQHAVTGKGHKAVCVADLAYMGFEEKVAPYAFGKSSAFRANQPPLP